MEAAEPFERLTALSNSPDSSPEPSSIVRTDPLGSMKSKTVEPKSNPESLPASWSEVSRASASVCENESGGVPSRTVEGRNVLVIAAAPRKYWIRTLFK